MEPKKTVIGVLALQGDFEAHRKMLDKIHVPSIEVRLPEQLQKIDGLILPGGESTTLIKLMHAYHFVEPLRLFVASGGAIYGTCAGAILMAKEVLPKPQFAFGFMDLTIARNSYGRQVDSFEKDVRIPEISSSPVHAVFIRAPKILQAGSEVRILAQLDDSIIAARQNRMLVTTFHPELTDNPAVHAYFVQFCVHS